MSFLLRDDIIPLYRGKYYLSFCASCCIIKHLFSFSNRVLIAYYHYPLYFVVVIFACIMSLLLFGNDSLFRLRVFWYGLCIFNYTRFCIMEGKRFLDAAAYPSPFTFLFIKSYLSFPFQILFHTFFCFLISFILD